MLMMVCLQWQVQDFRILAARVCEQNSLVGACSAFKLPEALQLSAQKCIDVCAIRADVPSQEAACTTALGQLL